MPLSERTESKVSEAKGDVALEIELGETKLDAVTEAAAKLRAWLERQAPAEQDAAMTDFYSAMDEDYPGWKKSKK